MRRTAALTAVLLLLCACNRDEEITADGFAPVITLTGCDDSGTYYVHPGESLTIAPDYENARGAEYSWTLGVSIHDICFASQIYQLMEKNSILNKMPEVDMKDPMEKFWV